MSRLASAMVTAPVLARASTPRHIAHVVFSFRAGGLENVIIQLLNRLPSDRYRHTVIALTEYDEDFVSRASRPDLRFIAMKKPPGQTVRLYPALWRLFRELQPDVVHTCNLAALEVMPMAWLAGVPVRIHAEHGWTSTDPDGSHGGYRMMRRVYRPFVSRFIAVSRQLQDYLTGPIGVKAPRVELVSNGVDCESFRPRTDNEAFPRDWPFSADDWVVGTVGRLDPVKNQQLLIEACARLIETDALAARQLKLLVVGEGGERAALEKSVARHGLADRTWMPGSRSDVARLLRALDCFVLPSLAEGTSCTLQEAMASGLPIIATAVGGNPDVLDHGRCGALVPSGDREALAAAMACMLHDRPHARELGQAARRQALQEHSVTHMVSRYEQLFAGAAS